MSNKRIVVKLEQVTEDDFLKLIKHKIKSANKKGRCVSVSSDVSNIEETYIGDQKEPNRRTGYEEIIIRIEV